MTPNSTIRILTGLLTLVVIVVGATVLFNGGDEGGDSDQSSEQSIATAGGGGEKTQGTRGKPKDGGGGQNGAGRGSGGSRSKGASPEGEEVAADAVTEDEQQAQVNAQRFYDILGQEKGDQNSTEFDSESFCALMSDEAREQTIEYARRSSGLDQEWNCENSVELLVLRSKRTGGFKRTRNAKIVGVNAEGDRATATVRFGKGPLTSISLVKEGDEWKLGAPPSGS